MTIEHWPNCAIHGCGRKSCRALNSIYCFPHTPENEHVKRMKIDALHGTDPEDPEGVKPKWRHDV